MGKQVRRREASTAAPQPSPETPPKQPWYKNLWLGASTTGGVAFALGLNGPTILQNMRKIPEEVSVTTNQYLSWVKEDEHWGGHWSTFPEGIVNMEDMNLSKNTDFTVSLTAKNGDIGGEISTGEICRVVPHFDFLLLRRKVNGTTARVTVWDIIGGKTVEFGEIDLVRDADVITVRPLSGNTSWFPNGARIGSNS